MTNHLPDAPSSIHWHGILLPANMDGVPGMSFDGIAPGESWLYRFTLRQSGTYWYHSHSMFQEQAGLYGAIIVDPLQPPPYRYDREHVLLLSDWTDLEPAALFRRLKKAPSYDNYYKRTVGDFARDVGEDGLRATLADRGMWGRMRMTPSDLSDVNGHTYTYLLNGQSPAGNWTGLFRPGEKVLLRLVNAGAMTYFDVRIPGLKMTVVAADGQYVPDCLRVKRYSHDSPGAMPSKLIPGTPSMLAGSTIPCQWIEVIASRSRLATRSVTVSPWRQRRIGAGRLPLTVMAGRVRPVKLTGVLPIDRSKLLPASTCGPVRASADACAGRRRPAVPSARPPSAGPCTKRRRDSGACHDGRPEEWWCIEGSGHAGVP